MEVLTSSGRIGWECPGTAWWGPAIFLNSVTAEIGAENEGPNIIWGRNHSSDLVPNVLYSYHCVLHRSP